MKYQAFWSSVHEGQSSISSGSGRSNKSNSSSSASDPVDQDAEQYHAFQPINQAAPQAWAPTERVLPPSPIRTDRSFEQPDVHSPLPSRNLFDQRGGELPYPFVHQAENPTFEGYHEQHKIDRTFAEREEMKQFPNPSPPPPQFVTGFYSNATYASSQLHHYSHEDSLEEPYPHVSCHHHHMTYRFAPHYAPSTWNAMFKPDARFDRKPSAAATYSQQQASPAHTSGKGPTYDSPPIVAPMPVLQSAHMMLPTPAMDVPPAASRDPAAYAATNSSHSTSSHESGRVPPPSKKPNRRSKQRGGRREPVPPEQRTNHVHEAPTPSELNGAKTNRTRKAIHSWYERFNDLVDYTNAFGDTNVPQQYSPNHALGIWVNKQRMEMKAMKEGAKSSMTPRRERLLEKINFEPAKPKGQAAWDEKFQELAAYKRKFGDCHVPTKYKDNRPLGRWVSTQRNLKKNYENGKKPTSLSDEEIHRRLDTLERIGFAWCMIESPSSNDSS